jgi:hypothetical protein
MRLRDMIALCHTELICNGGLDTQGAPGHLLCSPQLPVSVVLGYLPGTGVSEAASMGIILRHKGENGP